MRKEGPAQRGPGRGMAPTRAAGLEGSDLWDAGRSPLLRAGPDLPSLAAKPEDFPTHRPTCYPSLTATLPCAPGIRPSVDGRLRMDGVALTGTPGLHCHSPRAGFSDNEADGREVGCGRGRVTTLGKSV